MQRSWLELPAHSEVLIWLEEMSTNPHDNIGNINEEELQEEETNQEDDQDHQPEGTNVQEMAVDTTVEVIDDEGNDKEEYRDMPVLWEITDKEMANLAGVDRAMCKLDTSMTTETVVTSNVNQDTQEDHSNTNEEPQHGYNLRPNKSYSEFFP